MIDSSAPAGVADFVIVGATGDLALRKLMPALLRCFASGRIPPSMRIIGVAIEAIGDPEYRHRVRHALPDAIAGSRVAAINPMPFMRRDEVEAAWAWIDPVVESRTRGDVLPVPYAAGSWGPPAAAAMMARDGRQWHEDWMHAVVAPREVAAAS